MEYIVFENGSYKLSEKAENVVWTSKISRCMTLIKGSNIIRFELIDPPNTQSSINIYLNDIKIASLYSTNIARIVSLFNQYNICKPEDLSELYQRLKTNK